VKLPGQKRILREDLKDAPEWAMKIVDPLNTFMQTVYQALSKNISEDNTLSQVYELTYKTPAAYPTMDPVEFTSLLKVKAQGVQIMQLYEKDTYVPASGPCYAPWTEEAGKIRIYPITGLVANKTYIVRVRIT